MRHILFCNLVILISTAKKSYAEEVIANDMCQWGCQLCKEDGGTNPLCRIILEECHSFCDDTKTLKKNVKEVTDDKTKDIIPADKNDAPKIILDQLLQAQFDQRSSYTKLLCRSQKFHQLCSLSSTIQWCYPKY